MSRHVHRTTPGRILKVNFARHETFHPRFGWLKKGYDHIMRDPQLFTRKNEAHIALGVGKNMALSIKYWLEAFKLLAEDRENGQYRPTELGQLLMGQEGLDPWLEDPASLWLLHHEIAGNEEQATSWYYLFNHHNHREFTAEEATLALSQYVEQNAPPKPVAPSSLEKDINCILRMYHARHSEKKFIEETLDSPFVELQLIQRLPGTEKYAFHTGVKSNLPAPVLAAICLRFIATLPESSRTISLSRLTYETRSPGIICKVHERTIEEAIEQVSIDHPSIAISNQAGVAHLAFEGNPGELARVILQGYYQKANGYTQEESYLQSKVAVV